MMDQKDKIINLSPISESPSHSFHFLQAFLFRLLSQQPLILLLYVAPWWGFLCFDNIDVDFEGFLVE